MSNIAVIGIYIPVMLTIIAIFISALVKLLKTRRDIMFLLLCFCMIGWISVDISVLLIEDAAKNLFIWNVGLIFVGFSPPLTFLIFFNFYLPERKLPAYVVFLIFLIPALNTLVVLTSNFHSLIREVEIISIWPVRDAVVTWREWFWVHTAFCYAATFASAVMIMYGYIKKPKFYRVPSFLFIASLAALLVGNQIFVMGFLPINLDPTGIGAVISVLFMYLALYSSNNRMFAYFARGQVFGYLEDHIFILNKDGNIVDLNPSAQQWLSPLKIDLKSCSLQKVLDVLEQNGALVKKLPESGDSQDIHFMDNDFPLILNLRVHKMFDGKTDAIGSIAIFTNVTENRVLLELLEKKAGIDYLTGLANRMAYEGAKARLDSENHLPLSVVICDVNGLKNVNDTLGHRYGDRLIQVVSEVLKETVNKSFFLARIGGDEFILLLSGVGLEYAYALIGQIKDAISKREDLPFALSVALGAAEKKFIDENIEDVIALADGRMYKDKNLYKG